MSGNLEQKTKRITNRQEEEKDCETKERMKENERTMKNGEEKKY